MRFPSRLPLLSVIAPLQSKIAWLYLYTLLVEHNE